MTIVIITASLAGIAGIFGQLTINKAIDQLPDSLDGMTEKEVKTAAGNFTLLHKNLKFILVASAALIVLTILTTDAMKRSINAEIKTNIEIFPSEFVYIYGLVFTFYLAIFYLPVFYHLRKKGELLAADVAQTEKENADSAFFIKETPLQNFITVFSILSPIITSLAPDLLKL
jgi:hypothetical protein